MILSDCNFETTQEIYEIGKLLRARLQKVKNFAHCLGAFNFVTVAKTV